MGTTIRAMDDHMINAQISHLIEAMKIDPEMDLSTIRMGIGEKMGTPLVLHRIKGETSHKIIPYRQPRSDHPKNSAFRRFDNRPTTGFTAYEQKFPQNNDQTSSNVVRFTTSDDTVNELSDVCPLNY